MGVRYMVSAAAAAAYREAVKRHSAGQRESLTDIIAGTRNESLANGHATLIRTSKVTVTEDFWKANERQAYKKD